MITQLIQKGLDSLGDKIRTAANNPLTSQENFAANQAQLEEAAAQQQYQTQSYDKAMKSYNDAKSKYDDLASKYTGAAAQSLANAQGTQTAARAGRQAAKSATSAARTAGMSKAQAALGGMASASDAASSNFQNGVDNAFRANESAMNYGSNSLSSAQTNLQYGLQQDQNKYNAQKDKYNQAYAKYNDDLNRYQTELNNSANRNLQREQFDYQKENDKKNRWANVGSGIASIVGSLGGAAVKAIVSDEDLKTIYPNMSDDMLAKFAKIRSYEYKYTPEAQEAQEKTGDFPGVDNEPHTGILAQEVEKAIPNAVTENPEGFKMIKENELTNANTGAIGELSRRVLSLEDMLKEMAGYIKANGVNYIDSNNYLNGENNGTK